MNPTLDYSRKARDSDFVLDEVEEGVVLSFPIPPRSRFYLPMGIIVMAVCIELLVLVMMIRAVRVHWIYSRAHPSDIEAIALHSLVLVAGCAIAAVYYRNDRRWRNYRSSLSANRSGVTWQRRGTWGIRVTTFAASEIYGVAIRPIWVPWGKSNAEMIFHIRGRRTWRRLIASSDAGLGWRAASAFRRTLGLPEPT